MYAQSSFWAGRRTWLAGVAALVAVVSLLAFPPLRAAADQLLSVFRAQKIVFMPVSQDRLKQIQDLNLKGGALFVGEPQATNHTPPRAVASADEAAAAAGYAIAQPSQLPSAPTSTEFKVMASNKLQFQVNLATVRQALDLLDIRDVSIPDELGAQPITVETQPFVATHYTGANYDLTLNQSMSPNVTLPDGVDLAQLGKAALRVLGMSPDQAEVASRQINWSNTLLFPFPSDANNIRQLTVGGEPALLIASGPRRANHWQLYWQRGERMYVLSGTVSNMQEEEMIALLSSMAESVR